MSAGRRTSHPATTACGWCRSEKANFRSAVGSRQNRERKNPRSQPDNRIADCAPAFYAGALISDRSFPRPSHRENQWTGAPRFRLVFRGRFCSASQRVSRVRFWARVEERRVVARGRLIFAAHPAREKRAWDFFRRTSLLDDATSRSPTDVDVLARAVADTACA